MFEVGFNTNLLQYISSLPHSNNYSNNIANNDINNNNYIENTNLYNNNNNTSNTQTPSQYEPTSFFGSYLNILNENSNKYTTNPFFSEMQIPPIPSSNDPLTSPPSSSTQPLFTYNPSSFFGAFTNFGTTYHYGIPPLTKPTISKPSPPSFETHYNAFLSKYPSDTPTPSVFPSSNNQPPIINNNTNEQQRPISAPKDIFTQTLLSNNLLSNTEYNTSQLILTPSHRQYHYNKNTNVLSTSTSTSHELLYQNNILPETCFLNLYKTINYDMSLQKEYNTLLSSLSLPIDNISFYNDLIYLIQGIPSKVFQPQNAFPFTFEITVQYQSMRFISTLPELTKNILMFFMNFGTKMQLIQYFLRKILFNITYDSHMDMPFVMRQFYINVNEIIININEKIMLYKNKLISNNITLIGLYNNLYGIFPIVEIIFCLFDFINEKNYEYHGAIEHYYEFYMQNIHIKQTSHVLIDNLLYIYNGFYNNKNKVYFLVKRLLLSVLHSYLFFIVTLLFTGDIIDEQKEFFIIKSVSHNNNNDNRGNSNSNSVSSLSIAQDKVPQFLQMYKTVLLNNTILINSIKQHEDNLYSVLTYKLNEILQWIDTVDLNALYIERVDEFILVKEKIFNKKVELMFSVNESIVNQFELEINKANMKKINLIKYYRAAFTQREQEELKKKEEIKMKKRKYYEDIQMQIEMKQQRIQNEINKIKNEQLEEKELEKEKQMFKEEVIQVLKKQYEKVKEEVKDIEMYGSVLEKWKHMRRSLKEKREEVFNGMFEVELFDWVYPVYVFNKDNCGVNYHFMNREGNNAIEIDGEDNNNVDVNGNVNGTIVNINQIDVEMKNEEDEQQQEQQQHNDNNNGFHEGEGVGLFINNDETIPHNEQNDIEMKDVNENDNNNTQEVNNNNQNANTNVNIPSLSSITLPKFFISNIIRNDILIPIIETSIEIASKKQLKEEQKQNRIIKFTSHAKTSKAIESEVSEILNKITLLLSTTDTSSSYNSSSDKSFPLEFPIQSLLQEFFYDIIIKQYKLTNHCFVLMLKNKFHILSYFTLFNNIFLCGRGDINLQFIENIFDFRTLSLKSNDTEYITLQLKQLIYKNYSNSFNNSNNNTFTYETLPLNENEIILKSFIDSFVFKKISQLNLNFSITNLDMSFELVYNAKEPLDFIFSSSCIQLYDSIFKKLLKMNIYNQIFSNAFAVIKSMRSDEYNEDNSFKKIMILFNESVKILKSFHTFIYHEIIAHKWNKLFMQVKHSANVFDIINAHMNFLTKLHHMLFNHQIIVLMERLYSIIAQFHLKAVIINYFDYNSVKDDNVFVRIVNEMKSVNKKIITVVNEEYVLGEFFNFRKYI